MDNINVLIIEDNAEESKALAAVLIEHNYHVVDIAANYNEAIRLFYQKKVDIVIIDVFLEGNPDGLKFAETINMDPHSCKPFVFLTNSKDRQIFERAKLTRPFSFLLKPFNQLEIMYAIEMAVENFYAQKNVFAQGDGNTVVSKEYLYIKKYDALKKVKVLDIIYIEVEDRYCKIITENDNFLILISLTKILSLLDPTIFYQTHRNYAVNSEKILEIVPAQNYVLLEGNHHILLSEKYKSLIRQFFVLK